MENPVERRHDEKGERERETERAVTRPADESCACCVTYTQLGPGFVSSEAVECLSIEPCFYGVPSTSLDCLILFTDRLFYMDGHSTILLYTETRY